MNTRLWHARQASLALLVTGVLGHGHLLADGSGSSPSTDGLTRLGQDLVRRAASTPGWKWIHVIPGTY